MENIHFIQDVNNFKRFATNKAEQWVEKKAQLIFHTYMEVGSVMEVNVSYLTRDTVRKLIEPEDYEATPKQSRYSKTRDLENAFDTAVMEITSQVLGPMLMDFFEMLEFGNYESAMTVDPLRH